MITRRTQSSLFDDSWYSVKNMTCTSPHLPFPWCCQPIATFQYLTRTHFTGSEVHTCLFLLSRENSFKYNTHRHIYIYTSHDHFATSLWKALTKNLRFIVSVKQLIEEETFWWTSCTYLMLIKLVDFFLSILIWDFRHRVVHCCAAACKYCTRVEIIIILRLSYLLNVIKVAKRFTVNAWFNFYSIELCKYPKAISLTLLTSFFFFIDLFDVLCGST